MGTLARGLSVDAVSLSPEFRRLRRDRVSVTIKEQGPFALPVELPRRLCSIQAQRLEGVLISL